MDEVSKQTEDLSALVVLADPSDIESLGEIKAAVEALLAKVGVPLRSQVTACLATLTSLIASGGGGDEDLRCVEDLLETLRRGVAAENDASRETWSFGDLILPEEVDEALLQDFLGSQVHSLEEVEAQILRLDRDGSAVAALRRRIHTLKGEAGMMGLVALAHVCHVVEDMLVDDMLGPDLSDRLLDAKDWIEAALPQYAEGREPAGAEELIARLRVQAPEAKAIEVETRAVEETKAVEVEAKAAEETKAVEETKALEMERVDISPVERDEEDLLLIGEFLQESDEGLANVDQILLDGERDGLDAEKVNGVFRVFHTIKGVSSFLEFDQITGLAHATETMLDRVRSGKLAISPQVFDLIFDATTLMRTLLASIRQAISASAPFGAMDGVDALIEKLRVVTEGGIFVAPPLPDVRPTERLGEVLLRQGEIDEADLNEALREQKQTGRKLGQELVAEGAVGPKVVAKVLRAQGDARIGSSARIRETVKVDLDRVDALVENIGELVIVESMVSHAPEIQELQVQPRIRNYLGQLAKITRQLQEIGIRMRMVPLRGAFQKMSRMVRDLARKSDKAIRVEVSGTGTEMDRSMVEQISDPLVHLIRNSVDHGIESPEERQKAKKSPTGTIYLDARYEGSSVVVEIRDDGRGLDREAILAKARRQGIVREGESLSDAAIDELIFAPGFSTAKEVTEISGRGVGMDVVRRNVEGMHGRIRVASRPGEGTTLSLVLPLTLAIIDGTLIACGQERYIFPTTSIVEALRATGSMLSRIAGRDEVLSFRDRLYPMIRLGEVLNVGDAESDAEKGLVMIVESRGRRIAVLVDDVLMQQQIVIKRLSGATNVSFFSGAAILSDGRVGLILDPDELASLARDREKRRKEAHGIDATGAAPS